MGLFQDYLASLPGHKRLAALVLDPARLNEITHEQWPHAILICALACSHDADKQNHSLNAYKHFTQASELEERLKALQQLEAFLTHRKGEEWRALLPFALAETEPALACLAAMNIILLCPPDSTKNPLVGAQALCNILLQDTQAPTALLDALFNMADLRLEPMLAPLSQLPIETLERHFTQTQADHNRLSLNWLLSTTEIQPQLAEKLTQVLCRNIYEDAEIFDQVTPMPCWAFQQANPQALHSWTQPEYYARMLPQLGTLLTADQLARVAKAFKAS